MKKPIFVFLAPLGSLLMLIFLSLIPFQMMSLIGEMLQPHVQVQSVSFTGVSLVGGVGATLFGVGVLGMLVLRLQPTEIARKLLVLASLLMFAGAALNFGGNLFLRSAFQDLAMVNVVESHRFLDSIWPSKPLLLVGHSLVMIATIGFVTAAMKMDAATHISRTAVAVGVISFIFLLLLVIWEQMSVLSFSAGVGEETVEPSSIAGGVLGVLRSGLLFQVSICGFAFAMLFLAGSRRDEDSREQAR